MVDQGLKEVAGAQAQDVGHDLALEVLLKIAFNVAQNGRDCGRCDRGFEVKGLLSDAEACEQIAQNGAVAVFYQALKGAAAHIFQGDFMFGFHFGQFVIDNVLNAFKIAFGIELAHILHGIGQNLVVVRKIRNGKLDHFALAGYVLRARTAAFGGAQDVQSAVLSFNRDGGC